MRSDIERELESLERQIVRLLACRHELVNLARDVDQLLLKRLVAGTAARWAGISAETQHPEVLSPSLLQAIAQLDARTA